MTTRSTLQESPETEYGLLSSEERAIVNQIAAKEPPYSQRAVALLALDEGATQAEAGRKAELTRGQVRYWLGKFRKERTSIFPQELLNHSELEDAGEEEAKQKTPDIEEKSELVVEAVAQNEGAPKAKKKPKKKSKKNSEKSKKSKKSKKKKKTKKGKKKKGKKSAKKSKKKRRK